MNSVLTLLLAFSIAPVLHAQSTDPIVRVGMIGLDTSHSVAFTQVLNDSAAAADVAGFRVVAAYPQGSPDIATSVRRVPEYTLGMQELGVEIVDSIEALLEMVDVVMLETNDGRPHYAQALPVLKAGKPLFIDKPLAGSLADAIRIFEAAKTLGVPVFSSSSLRYSANAQAVRAGAVGAVFGAEAYSPATLEPTHPDLFWYGIHGVETLFTAMGIGCQTVQRVATPDTDLVIGTWEGGRIGTFRGLRAGKTGYGGVAYGETGIHELGPYDGYRPLVVEIARFFRTGTAPVTPQETLEIYTFMEAADESKRRGGEAVSMSDVYDRARVEAAGLMR